MDRRACLILLSGMWIAGCSKSEPDQTKLPEIGSKAGIRLPASSQIVFEQDSKPDSSGLWIIRADDAFQLPGDKELSDSNTARAEIEKHLKDGAIGELSDGIAINNRWRSNDIQYSGVIIRSSRGYFLRLERFAQH